MAIYTSETQLYSGTSETGTVETDSVKMDMPGFSIHAQWSGTVTGTIKLQGRISENLDWLDLTGTEQTLEDRTGYLWNLREQHYIYFRAVVTVATGSADTLEIYHSAKAIY